MTNPPTPLQKAVDMVSLLNEAQSIVEQKCTFKKFVRGTPLANDIAVWMAEFAAKQLSALQTENEGLMLRSVAAMHIAEEENYSSISIDCPMLGAVLELRQDRDSIKSALESMTKERDELAENINLLADTWRPIFAGKDLHKMFSNARKENEKMREALNKIGFYCAGETAISPIAIEAITNLTLTAQNLDPMPPLPPTNADKGRGKC